MDTDASGSLEEVLDRPGPAGELLALLAQLAPRPLPRAALSGAVLGGPAAEEALRGLIAAGHLRGSRGSVSLPGESAERIRAHLAGEPRDRDALAAALTLLHGAFPEQPEEFETWPRCRTLLMHVVVLARRLGALGLGGEEAAWLETRAAEYARLVGEFPLAAGLLDAAAGATGAERIPRLAAALAYTQGRLHTETGQLGRAEEYLDQALSIHLGDPGAGSAAARRDQIALAEVVGEDGDLAAARELVETAIADHRDAPPDRISCLARRRLAWVLMQEGDHEAAEATYRAALKESADLLEAGHPDLAEVRSELGALLLERLRWEEARVELRAAVDAAGPLLGDEHPLLGVARSNLGGALEALILLRPARLEVERALEIGEARLPAGHRAIWLRHRKLARILAKLDQPRAALEHAEAAAEISGQALGAEDPESARDQIAIAGLRRRLREIGPARRAYRRGIRGLEEAPDVDEAELAVARLGYARSLLAAGSLPRARRQLVLALEDSEAEAPAVEAEIRVELTGLLSRGADELARTLSALGREEEARGTGESVARWRREVLAELIAGGDLEVCLAAAQALRATDPDVAREALLRAGEIAAHGADAAAGRVAGAWQDLARTMEDDGDGKGARAALTAARALVEEDPEALASVLFDLGALEMGNRDLERAARLFEAAAGHARAVGAEELLALALLLWGRVRFDAEDPVGAEELFSERLALLRALPERDPLGEGVTLHDLADVKSARGERAEAIRLYREAASLKGEAREVAHEATTLFVLASELAAEDDAAGALDAFGRSLTLLRSLPAEDRQEGEEAEALIEMGRVHEAQGDLEAATGIYREALAAAREADDPSILSAALLFLGRALERAGEEEAEPVYRERLALVREDPDPDLEDLAITLHDLADVVGAGGEEEQAVGLYRESVDAATEAGAVSGAAFTLFRLGRTLERIGESEEAAAAYARRIELLESLPERDPAGEGAAVHDLAGVRDDQGHFEEAIGFYREAAERRRQGDDTAGAAKSLLALAMAILKADGDSALSGVGRGPEERSGDERRAPTSPAAAGAALPHLKAAEDLLTAAGPEARLDAAMVATMIAMSLESLGDDERLTGAREHARATIETLLADERYAATPGAFRVSAMLASEVEALDLMGELLVRLRAHAPEASEADALAMVRVLRRLGRVAERRGHFAAAADLYREHLECLRKRPEPDLGQEGIALEDLADAVRKGGDPGAACELYREAAVCFGRAERPRREARALSNLALAAVRAQRSDLALEVATESIELFRTLDEPDRHRFGVTLALLAAMEPDLESSMVLFDEADALLAEYPGAEGVREGLRRARGRREEMEAEDKVG